MTKQTAQIHERTIEAPNQDAQSVDLGDLSKRVEKIAANVERIKEDAIRDNNKYASAMRGLSDSIGRVDKTSFWAWFIAIACMSALAVHTVVGH